jgi:hypothetical protein
MDTRDIQALLAEHFMSKTEQSIASMTLTAISMAEAGGKARASLQAHFDKTHQSYVAFADTVPLSLETKKGIVEFLNRSPSDTVASRPDAFRFAFESCFVWQRLSSHRALHSLPPLLISPLDPSELHLWRRWLPTQLQDRCNLTVNDALKIRSLLVDALNERLIDTQKLSEAKALLLTNYESRTLGAYFDQLHSVKLYSYLYEYSLASELSRNGESPKAKHIQQLLFAVRSNLLSAIEIVPWCIFGMRYSQDLMRIAGQRFNVQAPFSSSSISAWQVVGTGSPLDQLKGSRASIENVAPRITAYLDGGS